MSPASPSDSSEPGDVAGAARRRALHVKAVVFAFIGLLNTAVDYGVFLLARAALQGSTAALGAIAALANACGCGTAPTMTLVLANLISWTVAVSGSYILNSSITFAAESGRRLHWRAYAVFVGTGIAGLLANTATLLIAAQTLLLPVWLAKGLAVLASFIVNFSLSHFIVFRPARAPSRHDAV
jgi:putative flippase GtrA